MSVTRDMIIRNVTNVPRAVYIALRFTIRVMKLGSNAQTATGYSKESFVSNFINEFHGKAIRHAPNASLVETVEKL
jgi:hypothetical protein